MAVRNRKKKPTATQQVLSQVQASEKNLHDNVNDLRGSVQSLRKAFDAQFLDRAEACEPSCAAPERPRFPWFRLLLLFLAGYYAWLFFTAEG